MSIIKCNFCGREASPGATECPYCHYRFKIDARVMTENERDTFEGVTIDEDGREDSARSEYDERMRREEYYRGGAQNIRVHRFGCGSGLLMGILVLCVISVLFFFFLPAYLIFAAVGAVIMFILRLFM